MKLLFVDDEVLILKAFERQFHKIYSVSVTSSSEEALLMVQRETFAVVVSDMRMPGMNGLDFLARVREISPISSQILLTGNSMVFADAGSAGYFRCLEKPCPRDCLLAALQEATAAYMSLAAGPHATSVNIL